MLFEFEEKKTVLIFRQGLLVSGLKVHFDNEFKRTNSLGQLERRKNPFRVCREMVYRKVFLTFFARFDKRLKCELRELAHLSAEIETTE